MCAVLNILAPMPQDCASPRGMGDSGCFLAAINSDRSGEIAVLEDRFEAPFAPSSMRIGQWNLPRPTRIQNALLIKNLTKVPASRGKASG